MGLVLGALVLAGIGGAVAYQQGIIGGVKETSPDMTQAISEAPISEESDPVSDKIANLLTAAQSDYSAGNYFQPAGSNATKKYQAVLVLDENNQAAKEGLRNISEIFATVAFLKRLCPKCH